MSIIIIIYGIFNMHNGLSVCCAHGGEMDTDESMRTRVEKVPHPASTEARTYASCFLWVTVHVSLVEFMYLVFITFQVELS